MRNMIAKNAVWVGREGMKESLGKSGIGNRDGGTVGILVQLLAKDFFCWKKKVSPTDQFLKRRE